MDNTYDDSQTESPKTNFESNENVRTTSGRVVSGAGFDVEAMLALPRIGSLVLSPDGSRLVAAVARATEDGKKFTTALHELDPTGERPARRLTRSAAGESGAAFAPDGSLLFISGRPDPEAADPDAEGEEAGRKALWRLPAGGGEAYPVVAPPGGVDSVAVARESGAVVFGSAAHPATGGWQEDTERQSQRQESGVGAQLFTGYPIRFWDHFLGPRERHLYAVPAAGGEPVSESGVWDLLPGPGRALELSSFDITPDGSTVVANRWNATEDPLERVLNLISVDVKSGKVRTLADDESWYGAPEISPDGRYVAVTRDARSTPEAVADKTLWLFDLESGEGRDLLEGFDGWPGGAVWSPDSSALFFTADEVGHAPVFRLDLGSGALTRLTREGAYGSLCVAPDGSKLYALRSTVAEPERPVVLDAAAEDGEPTPLRSLEELDKLDLPGRLERVSATADDGEEVPSWLLSPPGASAEDPAPLAVFIHGGPLNSWNSWHWRWNPHVFLQAGWAVLLPDPALSTGYGLAAIQRGWGRWGSVVYEDLMRAVDGAVGRSEIDGGRTIAMGGSFGGYMANWVAGHTDRFDAIITHASLWNLEGFHGTTDLGPFWEREFGDPYQNPERYQENSPHRHVGQIETPMLVIHGELDYRVPVSEALTLWTDLRRHGVESEFLYFPDENHWIQKPNNARLWYETILDFMDHHARGAARDRPRMLRGEEQHTEFG